VKPVPETTEAFAELAIHGDPDAGEDLTALAGRAHRLVPELVGVSVALLEEGLCFTFVATDEQYATLDGIQYADDGPCVHAVDTSSVVTANEEDLLDEGLWLLFAQAATATGVGSTLTLPVLDGRRATGSVNLYASTADAFHGNHDQLAELFGGWAGGAVRNADLSFRTRTAAAETPTVLRDQRFIHEAVGILVVRLGVTADEGLQRLEEAAERAGVSPSALARRLISDAVN
jgi:GAF domain-containing protein